MAAAMMSKGEGDATVSVEIGPDGSVNSEPLDEFIEKYFVKNSRKEEAAEDKEDPELVRMGIDDKSIGAINIAQKLVKQGKFNLPAMKSQSNMNTAYRTMMDKIAGKITKIANEI